jgi:hypothetical protein
VLLEPVDSVVVGFDVEVTPLLDVSYVTTGLELELLEDSEVVSLAVDVDSTVEVSVEVIVVVDEVLDTD